MSSIVASFGSESITCLAVSFVHIHVLSIGATHSIADFGAISRTIRPANQRCQGERKMSRTHSVRTRVPSYACLLIGKERVRPLPSTDYRLKYHPGSRGRRLPFGGASPPRHRGHREKDPQATQWSDCSLASIRVYPRSSAVSLLRGLRASVVKILSRCFVTPGGTRSYTGSEKHARLRLCHPER